MEEEFTLSEHSHVHVYEIIKKHFQKQKQIARKSNVYRMIINRKGFRCCLFLNQQRKQSSIKFITKIPIYSSNKHPVGRCISSILFVNISQISELKKKLFGYEEGPATCMPKRSAGSDAQTEEIER